MSEAIAIPAEAVPLLGDDEDFTPQLEKILDSTFCRFDSNGDDKLDVQELHSFAQSCNGKPFPDDEIQEMRDYLDWDDASDALTLKGFFQMYHLQTSSEPDQTWKDLRALGYDWQLELNASVAAEVAAANKTRRSKRNALKQAQAAAAAKVKAEAAAGQTAKAEGAGAEDVDEWLVGTAATSVNKVAKAKSGAVSSDGADTQDNNSNQIGKGGKKKKKKKKKKKAKKPVEEEEYEAFEDFEEESRGPVVKATEKNADDVPILKTTNPALQVCLNLWDTLCQRREIKKMCETFVPLDVDKEDLEAFAHDFETDQERWDAFCKEIHIIATGVGVESIEGDQETSAMFCFSRDGLAMEIDGEGMGMYREVVFVCQEGKWRAEG